MIVIAEWLAFYCGKSADNASECVDFGYSTTHMFYGQHLIFTLTRWQGKDRLYHSKKCKEF